MPDGTTTRPCAVCGQFYPADPENLREEVRSLLRGRAEPTRRGRVLGLISPHAGYMYSGATSAAGYALLKGAAYKTVVVVSPSHRQYFKGVSVYPGGAYATPLGTIPIDNDLRRELLDRSPDVRASEAGHTEEHAVEVQLPFLQEVLPDFLLLPLVMGEQTREICSVLGESLASVVRPAETLLVASTDLSHYHPADVADELDDTIVRDVEAFDPARLMDDLEEGRAEACGGGPMVAVLAALKELGATRVDVLHHCNSGDVSGERRSVVGYLSAAIYTE